METIIRHRRSLMGDRQGVSNALVVLLSLILITVIVANVVIWSYQMNQLDWEKVQEKVELENVFDKSPWLGGTKYTKTWRCDGVYETFTEGGGSFNLFTSYPSNYMVLGGTQKLSGSPGNLTSNDASYIIFRSYEAYAYKTDAYIAYRSNAGTFALSSPKGRTWKGESATLDTEEELPNAGSPVRWIRVAYCPVKERSHEKIVVSLSDDRRYDVFIWNGVRWLIFNDIGYHTGTTFYRGFDVVYERSSGRALIVYSRGTNTDGQEIGYRIWDGAQLSQEYLLGLPYTSGTVYWISLATASGTRSGSEDDNEIAMIYLDSNSDVHGYIWNGTSWNGMGATSVWDSTAATTSRECIAVAYEQLSGRAMFIWGDQTQQYNYYRIWDGSTLTNPTPLVITAQGGVTWWITLKPNPTSNGLMLTVIDSGRDLNTAYWNGNTWTIHPEHDGNVASNTYRCADFAWAPDGSTGLLVWGGTAANRVSYKIFTTPNWGAQSTTSVSGTHYWINLKTNTRNIPGDVKVLGVVLSSNYVITLVSWDGTTNLDVQGSATTEAATYAYECFDIEFSQFGESTFAAEVEFTGNVYSAGTPSQLNWTIDLSASTDSVDVIFQLWNYTASGYSYGGDGYIVSTVNQADITKSQTITINVNDFINATNGEWKMKISCLKTTSTPYYLKLDFIEINVASPSITSLSILEFFFLDLDDYPLDYADAFEVRICFSLSDTLENWFLKAYNWADGQYETLSQLPEVTSFENYTIYLRNWQKYVNSGNGEIRLEVCDDPNASSDYNQTSIYIDFLGVRALFKQTLLKAINKGAQTVHIISLWVINSTHHIRYGEEMLGDLFINPGEDVTQPIRERICLPDGHFIVKVVTERGNIAIFVGG